MAKYVAIFNDTLDDIEINGFVTMSERETKDYEELAESITWPFSYPMGDASLTFTSGEDLLTRIDFREISNEEFKSLQRMFNGEFGVFIDDTFLENLTDDEEDDINDDDDNDFLDKYGDDEY